MKATLVGLLLLALLIAVAVLNVTVYAPALVLDTGAGTMGDPIDDPNPVPYGDPIDDPNPVPYGDPIDDPNPVPYN